MALNLGHMMKNMVDIIVLTYNRLDYFKMFVEMVYENTNYPFRLIVVDNGSEDGTREYIERLKKENLVWKYVFNKENLPLASALTEGFKVSESEFVITVADDMMPPKRLHGPCWLEVFVTKMESDDSIGCINFVGSRRCFDKFKKERYA